MTFVPDKYDTFGLGAFVIGFILIFALITGLSFYQWYKIDTSPIVRDVLVDQKVRCIENGNQVYFLKTSVGRINCSERMFDQIQIGQPMDLKLYPVMIGNSDPRWLYRIENSPCEVVK